MISYGGLFFDPSGVGERNDYEEAGLSEDEAEADLEGGATTMSCCSTVELKEYDDELLFNW
jgi:hypothetical protein